MELRFRKYTVSLSAEALRILNSFIQKGASDTEAGGIILGRIIGENILVERLSVPTELDKRSKFFFERHRLSAQIIINYEYANSHGQITYLGEWHTHPENQPTPSTRDIRMIKQQLAENKIHTDFLLLLIQGRTDLYSALVTENGLSLPE